MRSLQLLLATSGIVLVGLGVTMGLTNPKPKAYENYASQSLDLYLKDNLCPQFTGGLNKILQSQCHSLVDTARPHLTQIIAQKTTRQNFLLFSIYETNLSIPSALPDYHVKTLGVFEQFYTYEAEQL
jgi:uncharacterized protein YceK